MPILEITIKKPVDNLKGHQSSGAWAPELWYPKILLVVLLTHIRWQSSSYFLVHNNITKTTTTIQHLWHLIPCTLSQKNPVNPLSSILYPISIFLSEVFVYNFRWCHWNNMTAGHWFEATKDCPRWADQEQEQGWLDWIWQMDDEVLPWQVAVKLSDTC